MGYMGRNWCQSQKIWVTFWCRLDLGCFGPFLAGFWPLAQATDHLSPRLVAYFNPWSMAVKISHQPCLYLLWFGRTRPSFEKISGIPPSLGWKKIITYLWKAATAKPFELAQIWTHLQNPRGKNSPHTKIHPKRFKNGRMAAVLKKVSKNIDFYCVKWPF